VAERTTSQEDPSPKHSPEQALCARLRMIPTAQEKAVLLLNATPVFAVCHTHGFGVFLTTS